MKVVNQSYKDPFRIMDEIGVLIDRAMLQIVNAMRHTNLQEESPNKIRRVDQLTRALEYLCDVEEYNKKIEGKLRGILKTNRDQKKLIRELRDTPTETLESFKDFVFSTRQRAPEEVREDIIERDRELLEKLSDDSKKIRVPER